MGARMSVEESAQETARLIRASRFCAALTGAGISTNAGIPDFRGPKGLYVTKQYDADKIFDIAYFYRDQKPFFEFARDFVSLEERIQPTPTHRFLQKLEEAGILKTVITQNIDALHQKAGSRSVLEVHGSIWKSYCLDCGQEFSYAQAKDKILNETVPLCSCGGVIKPDIVFFGENVKSFDEASELARRADLFFVIGTSCVVYPAAMLPTLTKGKIIVVNMSDVDIPGADIAVSVQEDLDVFFKQVAHHLNLSLE